MKDQISVGGSDGRILGSEQTYGDSQDSRSCRENQFVSRVLGSPLLDGDGANREFRLVALRTLAEWLFLAA